MFQWSFTDNKPLQTFLINKSGAFWLILLHKILGNCSNYLKVACVDWTN